MYFMGTVVDLTEPVVWRDSKGKTHYVQTCVMQNTVSDIEQSVAIDVWDDELREFLSNSIGRKRCVYFHLEAKKNKVGYFNKLKCNNIRYKGEFLKKREG